MSVFALVCLVACAVGEASQTPVSPTLQPAWTVSFAWSGGIAGFDRQLNLTSDGTATAADRRRQLTRTARATDDELAAIARLVAAARPLNASASCNDCFNYVIDLQNGERIAIRGNDAGLSGTAAEPLVNALRQLLTRLLSAQPQLPAV